MFQIKEGDILVDNCFNPIWVKIHRVDTGERFWAYPLKCAYKDYQEGKTDDGYPIISVKCVPLDCRNKNFPKKKFLLKVKNNSIIGKNRFWKLWEGDLLDADYVYSGCLS